MKPFVTAVWSDLVIASYAVPDEVLEPVIPSDVSLDRWDGKAYVSLVGFRFNQTRVLGCGFPRALHLFDFPQWNLRCYVKPKHGRLGKGNWPALKPPENAAEERGIVFLKEIVPHRLIAATVRLLYNEPYHAAPLRCRATQVGPLRRVRYDLSVDGHRHTLAVSAQAPALVPPPGSAEAFFTGQGWGCGRDHGGVPTCFHVTHPPWRIYAEEAFDLSVDFGLLYGSRWAFLQDSPPSSVILCEGSAVSVSGSLHRSP